MSEARPELGNGVMTAASAGSGALLGGLAGVFAAELAVIPVLFPEEFAGQTERLRQIEDIQIQLAQDQIALVQAGNIQSDAAAYSKLERRMAAEQAQLEAVESSHIPYDDIHTPVLAITIGATLLLGAVISVGRFRWQLYKEKREQASGETA